MHIVFELYTIVFLSHSGHLVGVFPFTEWFYGLLN
jgi:hypothetical protein